MALKLKSLLVEQPTSERADIMALNEILKMQQEIFKEALTKLKSVEYSKLPEEAAAILETNANTLCAAYIEYCDNTESTAKQYAEESVENIVSENTGTLFERIENDLDY